MSQYEFCNTGKNLTKFLISKDNIHQYELYVPLKHTHLAIFGLNDNTFDSKKLDQIRLCTTKK